MVKRNVDVSERGERGLKLHVFVCSGESMDGVEKSCRLLYVIIFLILN